MLLKFYFLSKRGSSDKNFIEFYLSFILKQYIFIMVCGQYILTALSASGYD